MVPDAAHLLDHRRHPLQRPQVAAVPERLRALQQHPLHLPPLTIVEARRPSSPPSRTQPYSARLLPGPVPTAGTLAADAESAGDLGRPEPSPEEGCRFQTAFLESDEVAAGSEPDHRLGGT